MTLVLLYGTLVKLIRLMSAKEKEQLLKLIEKLQSGSATDEELSYLTNFYMSHQESESWPISNSLKSVLKDKIFENIQSQTEISAKLSAKVIPFYKRTVFKYSVAASIAILIALTFVFKDKHKKDYGQETVNVTIKSGTDKATLTLEDGTNIMLKKGKDYSTDNITSNGEKIIYKVKNENMTPKIAHNTLTVPRGGQFFIQLADSTKVWLNSASQLKYPVTFVAGIDRKVELIYGEAYFEVSPSTEHNGASFIVRSKMQNLEVLGTEFNVKAYRDEAFTYTTLVEGKVAIAADKNKEILQPNEQAIVSANANDIKISEVDVYNEVSWRYGIFSFKGKSLEYLMKVLSRWYDVDVKFENETLKSTTFKGVLGKDQPLEDILSSIKSASVIDNYEIKNKTIIIK